jgi:hypothetical protein
MIKTFCLLFLAGTATWAGSLNFSMSGTFNAATSSTPYFGPNENWSVSFDIATNPAVVSDTIGQFTQVGISNVAYLVNGVETYTGDDTLYMYATPFYAGGFDLCLDSNCVYGLAANVGQQMYSGPESGPTISPAVYTTTVFNAYYFPVGQGVPIESGQSNLNVTVASTGAPEPSSFYLSALGIAAFALYQGRRNRLPHQSK